MLQVDPGAAPWVSSAPFSGQRRTMNTMQPPETIEIETDKVGCDGGTDPAAGHPMVYLTVDATGKVDCPYCGRRYVRRPGARGGDH
jgi:uncharacterized Zn-finger protein